jgi:hypothetical protein
MTIAAVCITNFAQAQEIAGKYAVEGKNLDGSSYTGTAEIKMTGPTKCTIDWEIADATINGVCIRMGNTLSAGYILEDAAGVVVYEIKSDGTLEGTWTVVEEDGLGTEKLTPKR